MGFQKGHKFGVRFQPGRSGNPAGRPKGKTLSEALRVALEEIGDKNLGQTNAELIATAILKKARRGEVRAFEAIRDTVEGKPAHRVTVKASPDQRKRERQVKFLTHTIRTVTAEFASESVFRVVHLQACHAN